MTANSLGGVLGLPRPSSPGGTVLNPSPVKSIMSVESRPPVLCAWVDSGGWYVELKNNGLLYKDGSPTDRGVTEHIYNHAGVYSPAYDVVCYNQWEQVPGYSVVNEPGSNPPDISVSYTHAITTQQSIEIALQFGMKTDGFEMGFSAKFGYSVTVSDSTTTTKSFPYLTDKHLYSQAILWQSTTIIAVEDASGNQISWSEGDVWAVIKPDYNSGTEYQSRIMPPKRVVVPGTLFMQTTWFNQNGDPVPAPES